MTNVEVRERIKAFHEEVNAAKRIYPERDEFQEKYARTEATYMSCLAAFVRFAPEGIDILTAPKETRDARATEFLASRKKNGFAHNGIKTYKAILTYHGIHGRIPTGRFAQVSAISAAIVFTKEFIQALLNMLANISFREQTIAEFALIVSLVMLATSRRTTEIRALTLADMKALVSGQSVRMEVIKAQQRRILATTFKSGYALNQPPRFRLDVLPESPLASLLTEGETSIPLQTLVMRLLNSYTTEDYTIRQAANIQALNPRIHDLITSLQNHQPPLFYIRHQGVKSSGQESLTQGVGLYNILKKFTVTETVYELSQAARNSNLPPTMAAEAVQEGTMQFTGHGSWRNTARYIHRVEGIQLYRQLLNENQPTPQSTNPTGHEEQQIDAANVLNEWIEGGGNEETPTFDPDANEEDDWLL